MGGAASSLRFGWCPSGTPSPASVRAPVPASASNVSPSCVPASRSSLKTGESSASNDAASLADTSMADEWTASRRLAKSFSLMAAESDTCRTSLRSVKAATSVIVPSSFNALTLVAGGKSSLMAALVSSVITRARKWTGVAYFCASIAALNASTCDWTATLAASFGRSTCRGRLSPATWTRLTIRCRLLFTQGELSGELDILRAKAYFALIGCT
jgi:hypothetical protein